MVTRSVGEAKLQDNAPTLRTVYRRTEMEIRLLNKDKEQVEAMQNVAESELFKKLRKAVNDGSTGWILYTQDYNNGRG